MRGTPAGACGYEVHAQPWPEIASFFRGIVQAGGEWAQPMLAFVEQVQASRHAGSLFAITSMHTLLVAGSTPFYTECEVLRIDYDAQQGDFCLEYAEQPHVHTRWRRRCAPDAALGLLENLAGMKGWIARG